ncbi:MAG: hypothetical protein R6V53_00105 [Candidatus Woesearchaeota archaeon]
MKKLFGIPFAAFMVAVLFIGGATAALVGHLSNEVEANVEVKSPIELKVAPETGGNWGDSVDLDSVYGGETATYRIQENILADTDGIDSKIVIEIFADTGIESCDEIEDIQVKSDGTVIATLGSSLTCSEKWAGDEKYLETVMDSTGMTKGTRVYDVETTFAANALGNYSATVQHMVE